ncbi:winged helix-turn-helix domain-containing protein [Alteromonas sp. 1_MG-2023]|uniref:winged helix-turn-helix domain-containing protein n=1 Tax=Alteromonas sp. 1_MG-2023 TaxID=3062669 RepID=UPI0026E39B73|nr:winged helix-turn-helix domain-containing protein [Alteromonas sp. 1_MG-2023]MDO6569236.1 winged helix-turn-helix domain-containing protein [Alteromonas sp. 1_MG-2023]
MNKMIYQVVDFQIDTANFVIVKHGEPVAVEPKVFDLIVYLIEHRDRLVTRDELFNAVWSGREVSDTTLSNHIKAARKLFGDNGEMQKIITTLRGRGYRFVATVTQQENTPYPEHASANGNSVPKNFSAFINYLFSNAAIVLFLTFLALMALLLGLGFITYNKGSAETDNQNIQPYILVLPFNVSSNNDKKWRPFAEQITREMITKFGHLPELRVVPSSSAFAFKNDKTLTNIKTKIPNVTHVLDATVNVSSQGKVKVAATLFSLETGALIWDQAFLGQVNDTNFFSIQSDIASGAALSLSVAISPKMEEALYALPTNNLAAYELYVEGQQQMNLLSHEPLRKSVELFSDAIALDPSFEAAFVARANAYRLIMSYFETPSAVLPMVVSSVQGALAVSSENAEALSSLGLAYVFAWRWNDAWKVLNAAKSQNSELVLTELGFALYYAGLGDVDGVKQALGRADELDPLNVELADWGHWALAMVGDFDAAQAWARAKIKQHPRVSVLYSGASVSLSLKGKHEEAIAFAKKGVALAPHYPFALIALSQAHGYAGDKSKIVPLLKQAEKLNTFMCPYETAISYLILDEVDRAFELLNSAVSSRSNCLVFSRFDPRLTPIRQDERFEALLHQIGLDDVSIASYER